MKLDVLLSNLIIKRDKVLNGGVNCIPLPFSRFRREIPGIQKGIYYLVSASTKVGKTQIANYLFIYNTILYMYYNPGKVSAKIFYFPLEESEEAISLRFTSFLISHLTQGNIKISRNDLKSLDERKPLPDNVIEIMNTDTFKEIYDLFERTVIFINDIKNPYGIYKYMKDYALANGKEVKRTRRIKTINEWTKEVEYIDVQEFDHYEPNNPDEYVFGLVDHVGRLTPEKGTTKFDAINTLSGYCIDLRDKYSISPVIIQQQNQETTNLEAVKAVKIRPTVDGLRDSKQTAHDCNVFFGMTSPYRYEIPNYMGYDITLFKDSIRFLEMVFDRDGNSSSLCPLMFEGNICNFTELPKPTETDAINLIYTKLKKVEELRRIAEGATTIKSLIALRIGNLIKKWQRF